MDYKLLSTSSMLKKRDSNYFFLKGGINQDLDRNKISMYLGTLDESIQDNDENSIVNIIQVIDKEFPNTNTLQKLLIEFHRIQELFNLINNWANDKIFINVLAIITKILDSDILNDFSNENDILFSKIIDNLSNLADNSLFISCIHYLHRLFEIGPLYIPIFLERGGGNIISKNYDAFYQDHNTECQRIYIELGHIIADLFNPSSNVPFEELSGFIGYCQILFDLRAYYEAFMCIYYAINSDQRFNELIFDLNIDRCIIKFFDNYSIEDMKSIDEIVLFNSIVVSFAILEFYPKGRSLIDFWILSVYRFVSLVNQEDILEQVYRTIALYSSKGDEAVDDLFNIQIVSEMCHNWDTYSYCVKTQCIAVFQYVVKSKRSDEFLNSIVSFVFDMIECPDPCLLTMISSIISTINFEKNDPSIFMEYINELNHIFFEIQNNDGMESSDTLILVIESVLKSIHEYKRLCYDDPDASE